MSAASAERIAIVGGGLMGVGVAQVFAAAGHEVALQDVYQEALDRAPGALTANLSFLAEHGLFPADGVEDAVGRVRTTTDLGEAVSGADVVVECVFEDLGLKQDVFERLDAVCPPETTLCTNTSVMSITQIGERTTHKERVVGTHFWNPPYLIPLVEVVRTEHVDAGVVDRTLDLLRRVGKHPIDCKKDVPGFVANRLQHALWREAISIVEHGIADAATVDESIRFGPGLRLPILGPVENADMVGLDLTHGDPRLHPAAPRGVGRGVAASQGEGRGRRPGLQERSRVLRLDAGCRRRVAQAAGRLPGARVG